MDLPRVWNQDCNCAVAFTIVSLALVVAGYMFFIGVAGFFIGRLVGTIKGRLDMRHEMVELIKKGQKENAIFCCYCNR